MSKIQDKKALALRRSHRVRARVQGTASRPRLCVTRSAKHIYAQLIDDAKGHTLASASDADFKRKKTDTALAVAHGVGKILAEKAKKAGVVDVVFDRGPYRFHGRIAALAQGAREAGLNF